MRGIAFHPEDMGIAISSVVPRLTAALQHLGKLDTKPEPGPVVVTVFPDVPIAETADSTFLKPPSPSAAPTAAPIPSAARAAPRTPLIVEPKPPPTPSKRKEQEQFEFVGDRRSFTLPPRSAFSFQLPAFRLPSPVLP